MKFEEAVEISKRAFNDHFVNRYIPQDLVKRLTIGGMLEGEEWIIEVSLLPVTPTDEGLTTDLCYPLPEIMVTIRVNKDNKEVVLIEEPSIKW
jgi:hypothetical protein